MRRPELARGLLFAALLGVVIYLFLTYSSVPVNDDAGYYVPIAREVMEGLTPTVDIDTGYPPLVYYAYSAWMRAFGDSVSTLMLLIYLVHLANAVLLFSITGCFLQARFLNAILSALYFCTVMFLTGHAIFLEPFQVLFVLAAFRVYVSSIPVPLKYAHVGMLLGVSIMFKQYSAMIAIGFLVTIAVDALRGGTLGARFRRVFATVGVTALATTLPFIAFVLATDATCIGALHSFGFLGDRAVSYATDWAQSGCAPFDARQTAAKLVSLHGLFIPTLVYVGLALYRRSWLHAPSEVLPIFVFSCLPILVRQYLHYFQLIAPWSFVIAAICLANLGKNFLPSGRKAGYLLATIALSFMVVLPIAIFATPSFAGASVAQKALTFVLFVLVVSALFAAWMLACREWRNPASYVVVVFLILGLEAPFLALKVPYDEMRRYKDQQLQVAANLNELIARGSEVFVVDSPHLYLLCDFRDPLRKYGFSEGRLMERIVHRLESASVQTIVVPRGHPLLPSGHLKEAGYQEAHSVTSGNYLVFTRSLADGTVRQFSID